MALGATVKPDLTTPGVYSLPVSNADCWHTLVSNPEATETEALTSGVANKPYAVTAATNFPMEVGSKGTFLAVALKYAVDTLAATLTAPIIRVFGKDKNGIWHLLKDAAGDDEVTLTIVDAKDVYTSATLRLTRPKVFDCQGSLLVMVCVQTAFNASAGTESNSEIIGKILNSR